MPNILTLPVVGRQPPPGPAGHPALRRLGRRLAAALTVLLLGTAAFAAAVLALGLAFGGAFLWLAPNAAYLGAAPAGLPGLVPFGSLPWPTRMAYAVSFLLGIVPVLLVLAELRALARTYAAGQPFASASIPRLRRTGAWLAAYAVAPAIGHGLVLLAGHGVDRAWLHASSLQALVLAATASVLAEVTRIGRAVEHENDGFV